MKMSPWEVGALSVGQEILCVLRKLKFYYRVQKGPTLDLVVIQFNRVYNLILFLEDSFYRYPFL